MVPLVVRTQSWRSPRSLPTSSLSIPCSVCLVTEHPFIRKIAYIFNLFKMLPSLLCFTPSFSGAGEQIDAHHFYFWGSPTWIQSYFYKTKVSVCLRWIKSLLGLWGTDHKEIVAPGLLSSMSGAEQYSKHVCIMHVITYMCVVPVKL